MSDVDKTIEAMGDNDLLKTALEVMCDDRYRTREFGEMVKDIAERGRLPLSSKQRNAVRTFLGMNRAIWF